MIFVVVCPAAAEDVSYGGNREQTCFGDNFSDALLDGFNVVALAFEICPQPLKRPFVALALVDPIGLAVAFHVHFAFFLYGAVGEVHKQISCIYVVRLGVGLGGQAD